MISTKFRIRHKPQHLPYGQYLAVGQRGAFIALYFQYPIVGILNFLFNLGVASSTRYALNKNKYLLDPEVSRLEAVLERASPADIGYDERDALILWLALKTGARASEILAIRVADLNTYDRTIFVNGIKGSNDRELPLAPWLFERLRLYTEREVGRSGNLFPIGYHRLRQIWDWYRPAPKKFHALRHTFAIRLYRKTKDLRLVQVALGHRNITNTMIYADYVYSQQELRKLIL